MVKKEHQENSRGLQFICDL